MKNGPMTLPFDWSRTRNKAEAISPSDGCRKWVWLYTDKLSAHWIGTGSGCGFIDKLITHWVGAGIGCGLSTN